MNKARFMACCAALAALLISGSAWAKKPLKTFSPDGPYKVGVTVEKATLDGRPTWVMLWYPAAEPSAEPYEYSGGAVVGAAVYDAPADKEGGPYPLILFSHGMGACGDQSVYYTENLASYGYVVVAPDHLDSAMCHIQGEPDITPGRIASAAVKSGGDLGGTVMELFKDKFEEMGYDFSYRPREASAAIDKALEWNGASGHVIEGLIDPSRIGATGHSLGGYTTLMIGGVPFHCEDFSPEAGQCDMDRGLTLREGMDPCCMESVRSQGALGAKDERVKAILPLGPAAFFPEIERAASEIEVPIMIISGGHKKMEVPWEPIQAIYDNAPPPKYAIRLDKTDHMTISDMTLAASFLVKMFLPGFRSGYKKKAQAYKDYSAVFFETYLKGDDSRAGELERPLNKYVNLEARSN